MKYMHQLWTLKKLNKMKTFKNVFTIKGNNLGLLFQLSFFALFAIMSLFSGQTLAQQILTPTTTVTEGDLFPGGIVSFGVMSGPGSVTIDHVNAGTGTQSITVVGVPTNAVVNIPAFTPGTFNPVVVTITAIDPALPVDFRLRAASTFHAILIHVRCPRCPPPPCLNYTSTLTNQNAIEIPRQRPGLPSLENTIGLAGPYPSTNTFPFSLDLVTKVTVTLRNFNHQGPDDVDVLLVGPAAHRVILMSDAGGIDNASGVTLTFDSTVPPALLPDDGPLVSGTFNPTDFDSEPGDRFPASGSAMIGTDLGIFNGRVASGAWSLFVVDDELYDKGYLGEWSLSITRRRCNLPTI